MSATKPFVGALSCCRGSFLRFSTARLLAGALTLAVGVSADAQSGTSDGGQLKEIRFNLGSFAIEEQSVDFRDQFRSDFDASFSVGGISGSADAVIIPSRRIDLGLGNSITTPEVRADTRSGLRYRGDVSGYAEFAYELGISTGSLDASFGLGLQTTLDRPEDTFVFRPIDVGLGVQYLDEIQANYVLPSLTLGATAGADLGFDGRLEGALRGLGLHGGDIDIDIEANLDLFDLPDIDLPGFRLPDIPFEDNNDTVLREFTVGSPRELLSIQLLNPLNPDFVQTVNNRREALQRLVNQAQAVNQFLEGSDLEQAQQVGSAVAGWIQAADRRDLAQASYDLAFGSGDLLAQRVNDFSQRLGVLVAEQAAGDARAQLQQLQADLNAVFKPEDGQEVVGGDFFSQHFTPRVDVNSGGVEIGARWDIIDVDLDLDGLLSTFTPFESSVTLREKLPVVGDAKLELELLDVKIGPTFGLDVSERVDLDAEVTWTFDQNVLIQDAAGNFNLADTFTAFADELPTFVLLNNQATTATIVLDGLHVTRQESIDLVISDLGNLEIEVLSGGSLSLRNRRVARVRTAAFSGRLVLADFEQRIDLFSPNAERSFFTIGEELGTTTFVGDDAPVVPLHVAVQDYVGIPSPLSQSSFEEDLGGGAIIDRNAIDRLEDFYDPNNGQVIAQTLNDLMLRTTFDSDLLNRIASEVSFDANASVFAGDQLFEDILSEERQIVIAQQAFPPGSGADEVDLAPADVWLYGQFSAPTGENAAIASLRVVPGSTLLIEPAAIVFQPDRDNDPATGEDTFAGIRLQHVQNDGVIRLVGRPALAADADLAFVNPNDFGDASDKRVDDTNHEVALVARGGDEVLLALQGTGAFELVGNVWVGDSFARQQAEKNGSQPGLIQANAVRDNTNVVILGDGLTLRASNQDFESIPGSRDIPTIYGNATLINSAHLIATAEAGSTGSGQAGLIIGAGINTFNQGILEAADSNLVVIGEPTGDFGNSGDSRFTHSGQLIARNGNRVRVNPRTTIQANAEALALGGDISFFDEVQVEADASLFAQAQDAGRISFFRGIVADDPNQIVANVELDGGTLFLSPTPFNSMPSPGISVLPDPTVPRRINPIQILGSDGLIHLDIQTEAPLVWLPGIDDVLPDGSILWDRFDVSLDAFAKMDLSLLNPGNGGLSVFDEGSLALRNNRNIVLGAGSRAGFLEGLIENTGVLSLADAAPLALRDSLVVAGERAQMQVVGSSELSVNGLLSIEDGAYTLVDGGRLSADAIDVTSATLEVVSGGLDALATDVIRIQAEAREDGSSTASRLLVSGAGDYVHRGNVELIGEGASFNRLGELTDNFGRLHIAQGAVVEVRRATVTNESELYVDQGSFSVVGNGNESTLLILEAGNRLQVSRGGSVFANEIRLDDESLIVLDSGGQVIADAVNLVGQVHLGSSEDIGVFGSGVLTGNVQTMLEDSSAQALERSAFVFDFGGTEAGVSHDELTINGNLSVADTRLALRFDRDIDAFGDVLTFLDVEPLGDGSGLFSGAFAQIDLVFYGQDGVGPVDVNVNLDGDFSIEPGEPLVLVEAARLSDLLSREVQGDLLLTYTTGDRHGLAVTFVPEPSSLVFFGLGGLAALCRRRRPAA